MLRKEMIGGTEYNIKEVLGPKFKEFTNLLKSNNLGMFTYANFENARMDRPTGAKSNDVSHVFSEYVVAATTAFKRIENPDIAKANLASKYAGKMYSAYDELIKGKSLGFINPPISNLEFDQLPYYLGNGLKYLTSGFHYFSNTSGVYNNPATGNALNNAILYLYYYISILDLSNVNVQNIMQLLSVERSPFGRYVLEIADLLMDSSYFKMGTGPSFPSGEDARSLIYNGVLQGLSAVAVQIINDLRNVNVTSSTTFGINLSSFDENAVKGLIKKFKSVSGAGNADTAADTFYKQVSDFVTSIDQFFDTTSEAYKALPDKAEKYVHHGLMNPFYADETKYLKEIDDNTFKDYPLQIGGRQQTQKKSSNSHSGMKGGVTKAGFKLSSLSTSTGGNPPSLPFLYGPKDDNNKHVLITEDTTFGGKTFKIVNDAELGKFRTLIDDIAKSTEGDKSLNPIRMILMSMIGHYINKKGNAINYTDTELLSQVKKELQGYATIAARHNHIAAGLEFGKFRDAFVSQFVSGTYKGFTLGTSEELVHAGVETPSPNKPNLTDNLIWEFYRDYVASDPKFYGEFFNLVKSDGTPTNEASLTEALTVPEADRANYRLNVKKNVGYTRLRNLQFGGQGNFGDIVFITLIPDYPSDGSLGDIWLTRDAKITADQILSLGTLGTHVLQNIARAIYNTPPDQENVTIPGTGITINLPETVRYVISTGFKIDYKDLYRTFLKDLASRDQFPSPIASGWREGELLLTEHLFRERDHWVREGDEFVKRGKNGEILESTFDDNCTFLNIGTVECVNFLTQCLPANESNFKEMCSKLLDYDFRINPDPNVLKDEVQKINPATAFAILRQLKFGSHLVEEPSHPVPGFKRYKIQSVGSWLQEMMPRPCGELPAGDIICQKNLREQLGEDLADRIIDMLKNPNKRQFFNYLDILVQWVNANPQVLNPEELIGEEYQYHGNYPKINDSFRTYSYVSPYKPAEVRLRGVTCGLERLKANIMNELSGSTARSMISNIANVPYGIEMPLSRFGFDSPLSPFQHFSSMMGGIGVYETEFNLQNLTGQYGYQVFNDIYNDLKNTMRNLVGKERMKLTEKSESKIQQKLENFRATEEALVKSLQNLIEKNKLYQASNGHINPYVEDERQYAAILAKHSNLLNLSSAYNKRAVNLIDMFQTISNAILDKFDSGKGSTTGYQRPITMGYH